MQNDDHMRRASHALQNLNDFIKRQAYGQISRRLAQCDCLEQLSVVFDKDGQTIFFKVVFIPEQEKAIDYMQRFSVMGGHIKRKDNNKQSVIYYAARYNKTLLVRYLLSLDFAVNQQDYMMQTPLYYSARFNTNTEIVKMLLDAGCDPNLKDSNGQTCLFYAAAAGNIDICRLLAEHGANVLATDKNKERAMHYAKRNGHRHVYEYLSVSRNEIKKIKEMKEERRIQESSQNTGGDRRRKKEAVRNQYSLVYINQNGETKVLSFQQLMQFRKASKDNAKLVSMMMNPDQQVQSLPPVPDRRFEKTILKILTHFQRHQNGGVFADPVNYTALGLFDYPSIVKYPMDFGTIKRKITMNGYDNELQFQGDMNLVFDNCILYHGTGKDIGKIALQMKTQFNAMFFKQFS